MNELVYSRDQLNRMLERSEYRTYGAIISDNANGRTTIIRQSESGNWIVFEEYTLRSRDASVMTEESSNEGADRTMSVDTRNAPTRREVRTPVVSRQPASPRESRLVPELIGAGLSCGFTVVSAASLAAEGAATGLSGGTAGPIAVPLMIASWTGFSTGLVQCGLGIGRTLNEFEGNGDRNDHLDNSDWYQRGTFYLDALGVISSVSGIVRSAVAYRRTVASIAQRVAPAEATSLQANTRLWGRRPQSLLERLPESERGLASAAQFTGMRLPRSARQRFILEYNQVIVRTNAASQALFAEQGRTLFKSATRLMAGEAVLFGEQIGINAMPGNLVGVASGSINTLLDSESLIRRDIQSGVRAIDADIQARRQFRDPRGLTIHVIESGNAQ